MLTQPSVYTGSDNAFYGFNSTAGTIAYQWNEMITSDSMTLGIGQNQLNFQRIHQAKVQPLSNTSLWTLGYEADYSQSESDGTVAYSDHDFNRLTGRVQLLDPVPKQTSLQVTNQNFLVNLVCIPAINISHMIPMKRKT